MPSNHKYYELYSVGCLTARTETVAVGMAFGSISFNVCLFLFAISSDSYWSAGPPAMFHCFASIALLYSSWADKPRYCWPFIFTNAFTIFALALAFLAVLLLDLNPRLWPKGLRPKPTGDELRQLELAFLLLLAMDWLAQGVVWHFYRYLKYRKVERYLDQRQRNIHIGAAKRFQMQIGGMHITGPGGGTVNAAGNRGSGSSSASK